MPVKSAKQFRLMEAAAHGGLKSAAGPSPAVAKEFIKKTSKDNRSKFAQALKKKK